MEKLNVIAREVAEKTLQMMIVQFAAVEAYIPALFAAVDAGFTKMNKVCIEKLGGI